MKHIIKNVIDNYCLRAKRSHTNKVELYEMLNKSNKTLTPLNHDEKLEVNKIRSCLGTKPTYKYWELYKTFCGFDADFIADDDLMPLIIRSLNPTKYYKTLQFKGLYPLYYSSLNKPETILNRIDGICYDKNMNVVDTEGSLSLLFEGIDEFIIKPTSGGFGGKSVAKICNDGQISFNQLISSYGLNFICQKVVNQSPLTKKFNVTSLNTFRISVLNINGKCDAVNILFRHGRNNSVCDNGGAGGIMVGVDRDGRFKSMAYDNLLNTYDAFNGVKYKDVVIKEVNALVAYAENAHRTFLPTIGFAGWDLALDEYNNPVFIEVNLGYPGIQFEQLCNHSPIFGNRTKEVYDYVSRRKGALNFMDFVGSAV